MTASLRKLRDLYLKLWYRLRTTERPTCLCGLNRKMAKYKQGLLSEYVDVGGIETHVLKYGTVHSPRSKQDEQYLFLVIPGNPGIPEYYEQFMHTLWEKSCERFPVWCVGHAGHVSGPSHPPLGWTDIVRRPSQEYTLQGQIVHKINFIQQNIPEHIKLVLIGHSIGCYIILNLLPRIPQYDVLRCFMLFPTIERMAGTPNGRLFTPALNYLRWIIVGFVKMLSYLTPKLHLKMIKYHFSNEEIPECGVQATLNLFNPTCVNLSTFMAKIEMAEVSDLQDELLQKYVNRISFYFGAVDRWCPKEYCYSFREKFPQADVRLCQMDFPHAFVLDAGEEMAHTVWDWVQDHI